ncbi:MAG: hypothetical protein M3R38_16175 [Actinomycetota bacterium]|nr:hypothetical protein [Actinomycetota bacterium]
MTGEAVKPGAGAAKRQEARRAATVDREREQIEVRLVNNLVALAKSRPRRGGGRA